MEIQRPGNTGDLEYEDPEILERGSWKNYLETWPESMLKSKSRFAPAPKNLNGMKNKKLGVSEPGRSCGLIWTYS